jgi:hypothetical protein
VFLASDSGDEAYLRMIQSHCPAKQRLELKVGAQVLDIPAAVKNAGVFVFPPFCARNRLLTPMLRAAR